MKLHRHLVESSLQCLSSTFLEGYYADKAIEYAFRQHPKWGKRDRKFVATTVFEMVRWWRRIWALADQEVNLDREPLLRALGVYFSLQGYSLPEWFPPVPSQDMLLTSLNSLRCQRATWHSFPDWLDQLGQGAYGAEWSDILTALNETAPVVLRANRLKNDVRTLQHRLEKEGIKAHLVDGFADALTLSGRENVFRTQVFKDGGFEVQDGSSQLIAPLLAAESGMRVIDACAGAGGKSLHLAALMGNTGRIISMDLAPKKLEELKRRARRAGAQNIEVRLIENHKTIKRLYDSADRLLLDVPCTGTGVIKRNPDTKWKLDPTRLSDLQKIQADILFNYSPMVRRGGRMVYATCSILPQENQHQVELFLTSKPGWHLLKEEIRLPHRQPFDGFYAALLQRED